MAVQKKVRVNVFFATLTLFYPLEYDPESADFLKMKNFVKLLPVGVFATETDKVSENY